MAIEIGGWVPKGRIAEDGIIAHRYENLKETGTTDYGERTERNVLDSDATLIISQGALRGGSGLTKKFSLKFRKPFFHADLASKELALAATGANDWMKSVDCEILNVAGPRASEDAEIYDKTFEFLTELFKVSSQLS